MKYAVLGVGEATDSAVHEALADILKKDKKAEVLIHARRSPQGAVPAVYDFIVDNECRFTSYTRIDDKAPKPLLEGAQDVIKTETPMESMLKEADQVLLLWDEKDENASNKIAFMCADEGVSILDLTMALTPIVVDIEEQPQPQQEEAPSVFTRDELSEMTIAVLRRQAKAMGINIGANDNKQTIIDKILGSDMPEVASEVPTRVMSEYGDGSITWIQDGALCTEKLSASQVAWLIQELKHQSI